MALSSPIILIRRCGNLERRDGIDNDFCVSKITYLGILNQGLLLQWPTHWPRQSNKIAAGVDTRTVSLSRV